MPTGVACSSELHRALPQHRERLNTLLLFPTGAFAALVMVYAVPAGVQWAELATAARSSRRARAARLALTGGLLCCGCLTVAVQFE